MWHLEIGEVLGAMQMCKSHSADIAWLFTYQNVVKIKFLFQEYSMSFNRLHYALFFTLVSLKKAIQWVDLLFWSIYSTSTILCWRGTLLEIFMLSLPSSEFKEMLIQIVPWYSRS